MKFVSASDGVAMLNAQAVVMECFGGIRKDAVHNLTCKVGVLCVVQSRQADALGFEYRCHSTKYFGSSANIRFWMQKSVSKYVKICFADAFSTLHRCEAVFMVAKSGL